MTDLEIGFLFGCAWLVVTVSLMLYLILDYRQMCRASHFGSIEEAREDARRAFHAATGNYPLPTERRPSNPNPTPLYGERR